MRAINKIIIHCSATKEGKEFNAKDIDRWHKERGFEEIGYHYVLLLDGSVEKGRALEKVGAHCKGHNRDSIGVCYIGGLDQQSKPKDTRTLAQKQALKELIGYLHSKFPTAQVFGHRDFEKHKDCPCFDVSEYNL